MDDVTSAFAESKEYFPTVLQQFQFFDKYSRFDIDKGRRETWTETVDRTVNFLRKLSEDKLGDKVYDEIKQGILNMEVMPSMRLLATAGPAAERNNIAIYNCSFITVDKISRFADAVYILMSGTGMGFSVERRYTEQLPEIAAEWHNDPDIYVVDDSSEGWANAVQHGVSNWCRGINTNFDFSQIRPEGTPLKTKGGRASGPESLKSLMEFLHRYIFNAAGRKLTSIELHDMMCKVGEVIVSGGHRRSALISLFDFDDEAMMNAKEGDFWVQHPERWNANNSAVVPGDISKLDLAKFMLKVLDGGSGEPGIFIRDNASSSKPSRRAESAWGVNPSLAAGTRVWTTKGVFPIEVLEDKRFRVKTHTGDVAPAHCIKSGENKRLYEIGLQGGHSYFATPEHKWPVIDKNGEVTATRTDELSKGDRFILPELGIEWDGDGDYNTGFFLGWLYADGYVRKSQKSPNTVKFGLAMSQEDYNEPIIRGRLIGTLADVGSTAKFVKQEQPGSLKPMYVLATSNATVKEVLQPRNKSEGFPNWIWAGASREFLRGMVDGLFSADGHVSVNSNGKITLGFTSAHKKLAYDLSDVLGMFGIRSTISYSEVDSENVSFPNGKTYEGKVYHSYRLVVSKKHDLARFRATFRLSHTRKDKALRVKAHDSNGEYVKIAFVKQTDRYEDVWDVSVDHEDHSFALLHAQTGNCAEIILRPNEFCNLTSVVVRPDDDFASLMRKSRLATILGTIQAKADRFPIIDEEFKHNSEEERLIGVDLNGQLDNEVVRRPGVLAALKHVVVKTNKVYAKKLGIAQAAATTTVKPSGNSSQLLNTASGIHPRFAPYYIRRVRVNAHSPLRHLFEAHGVKITPENGQNYDTATTFVISFPVKAPEGSVFNGEWTALEQLEYWKRVKINYTEHNASITVTYNENEVIDIIKWISDNFEYIGGISFLPNKDSVYEQMPFEAISKEEYEKLASEMPDIDFSEIVKYESEDLTESSHELACTAGLCLF